MKIYLDLKSYGAVIPEPRNTAAHILHHEDYVKIDLNFESNGDVILEPWI